MSGTTRCFFVFTFVAVILSAGAAGAQVAWWDMKDFSDAKGGESTVTLVGDFGVGITTTAGGNSINAQVNAANSDGLAAGEGPDFGFGWIPVDSGHELAIGGSMTLFTRVYFDSYNGTDDIIRMAFSDTVDQFALELIGGVPRFKVRSGTAVSSVVSSIDLLPQTWYDITGVYNATSQTLELYVFSSERGNLVTSATATAPAFIDTGGDLLFFEDLNGANGINDGARMELAAIWDEALDLTAITGLSATLPTVVMTSSVPPGFTNAVWIPVTATFSEPVSGFTVDDITVTNASLLNFNGSSSAQVYTFILVPDDDGLVMAEIYGGSAFSIRTGLGNKTALPFARIFSSKPSPTVLLTSEVPPGETPANPIPMTVTFSEDVSGFTELDINLSNASVINFDGPIVGSTFTFDLIPDKLGDVGVSISLDSAQAVSSGLGNKASNDFVRTYARPTVILSTNAPEGTTSVQPLSIVAVFSFPVTNFDVTDILVTNGFVPPQTLVFNESTAGTIFHFEVYAVPGLVTILIPDGAATARDGILTNTASNILWRVWDQQGTTFPAAIGKEWILYE